MKTLALLLAACSTLGATLASGAKAQSITIAPGSGPGGGYLGLRNYGVSAIPGLKNDGHVTLTTPVVFAGRTWNTVSVGENGLAALGGAGAASAIWNAPNASLPDAGYAFPILAPLWTDIDVAGGGIYSGTLTDGTHSWLVIDWADVLLRGGSQRSSFELWIGRDQEDTTFSYANVAQPARFTIGAQDGAGAGTSHRYDAGDVPSNSELRVTYVAASPASSPVPEPASWATMLGGFGLAGVAMRRRRTRGVVHT